MCDRMQMYNIWDIILLLFNWTANEILFNGGATTMKHNTHTYTYHANKQTNKQKHTAQSYSNNKGHITHNEYNTGKKVKLSPYQVVERFRVVRCRGSHIVQTIGWQKAARLSTLHAGRVLPLEILLISIRGWVNPGTMVRLERLGALKKWHNLTICSFYNILVTLWCDIGGTWWCRWSRLYATSRKVVGASPV
jgi:hypothetical protein